MIVPRGCRLAASLLILLPPTIGALSAQTVATQTDWSGGPGVPGPVPRWSERFEASTAVSWRSVEGQLALSSLARPTPLQVLVAADAGTPNSVATADLDGDGAADLITTDPVTTLDPERGAIDWWRRVADGSWRQRRVSDDYYGAHHVDTADVDGDGDGDVIAAAYFGDGPGLGRNGKFAWFENVEGHGEVWAKHLVGDGFWGANWIDAGDLDGDGDLDLLGASQLTDGIDAQDADIAWFENLDGSGRDWRLHSLDDRFDNASQAHVADLDGDGDADVVGARSGDFGPAEFHWWENLDGDGGRWAEHVIPQAFWGAGYLDVGDVDDDGDLDLVGGGYNTGEVGFWENLDGSGTSWIAWHVTALSSVRMLELADIDGDGDLDALAANQGGWWIENLSGTGSVWRLRTVRVSFDSLPWLATGDADGDGQLEVVASDEDVYPPFGDQLLYFEIVDYRPEGELTSSVLDGGLAPAWGVMGWDAQVPAGTSLLVEVRASHDAADLGPFVSVPATGTDLSTLLDPAARFLQYRLRLSTADGGISPRLRQVGVDELYLHPPDPGQAGHVNSLRVSWPRPGEVVHFLAAPRRGRTALPACGLRTDLRRPVRLGQAVVDAAGEARLDVFVPPAAGGRELHFQAVSPALCELSFAVAHLFAP